MFTSSTKRRIRRFHVVVVQWTSKKCTKKRDARAELLFWSSSLSSWLLQLMKRRWFSPHGDYCNPIILSKGMSANFSGVSLLLRGRVQVWNEKEKLVTVCSRPQRDVPFHLHFTLLERFSYHPKIKTRQQNRNNKPTERERLGWFIEQIQTRVAFGWLSERSGEKTSCLRTF